MTLDAETPGSSPGAAARARLVPPGARYRVVLADPPWHHENYSAKGDGRSANRHYPVMSLDDICGFAREVGLTHALLPNCALLMWATAPVAAAGLHVEVMRAWGFRPSTMGAWLKTTRDGRAALGTGKVFRSAFEPFFVGIRGDASVMSHAETGVIEELFDDGAGALIAAERQAHSRKPDELHAIADRLWPRGQRIELFARRLRDGWDGYGNEIGGFRPAEVAVSRYPGMVFKRLLRPVPASAFEGAFVDVPESELHHPGTWL